MPDPSESLFIAIAQSNADAVAVALANGADPSVTDAKGTTPLVAAIRVGNDALVRELLARGAAVNALCFGSTALSVACRFRFIRNLYPDQVPEHAPTYEQIVRDLLAAGADVHLHRGEPSLSPIRSAMTHGTATLVEMLLAAGASFDIAGLDEMVSRGAFEAAIGLVTRVPEDQLDALLFRATSAGGGNTEAGATLVRTLIARGADPNASEASGATPLHHATYRVDGGMIRALIETGADLDAKTTQTWCPEDSPQPAGMTPRRILESNLRSMTRSPDDVDATIEDEVWQGIAAACGHDLPDWIRRVQAPRPGGADPTGRWVATMATVEADSGGETDVLGDNPPALTLDSDGRFSVVGGDGALLEGEGLWTSAKRLRKDGMLSPVDLDFDGEHAGTSWQLIGESPGTLTLELEDPDGRPLRWTFERAEV